MVGAANFKAYEQAHTFWITVLVMPLMVVEALLAALLLLGLTRDGGSTGAAFLSGKSPASVGAVLLLLIWSSTALIQMPYHETLAKGGFDAAVHERLVRSNWIRTLAWCALKHAKCTHAMNAAPCTSTCARCINALIVRPLRLDLEQCICRLHVTSVVFRGVGQDGAGGACGVDAC